MQFLGGWGQGVLPSTSGVLMGKYFFLVYATDSVRCVSSTIGLTTMNYWNGEEGWNNLFEHQGKVLLF